MDPCIAQIMQVGFNFAPVNWAIAAGQILPINQNAALFSLIGTTFGGNGTTTFGLPNLQSRVAVGVGQSPGLSSYVWGQLGGMEQVTLNVNQMPMHTHAATFTAPTVASQVRTGVPAAVSKVVPAAAGWNLCNTSDSVGGATPQIYCPAGSGTGAVNLANDVVTGGSVTNALAGGNLPTPVLQPYLALYSIIALSGVFPTRG